MTALLRLERRLVTHSDMLLPPPSKALLPVLFYVCARTTRSPPRITPVLSTVGAVISSRFLELISPALVRVPLPLMVIASAWIAAVLRLLIWAADNASVPARNCPALE